jgi:hypothetical protein
LDENIFFNQQTENILIASGKVNTQESKKITFTVQDDISTSRIEGMTLVV